LLATSTRSNLANLIDGLPLSGASDMSELDHSQRKGAATIRAEQRAKGRTL